MNAGAAMYRPFSVFKRAVMFTAIWGVLVGAERDGLVAGLLVVPVAVWMSLRLMPPLNPPDLLRLLAVIPGFLFRSVIGGVDVAWRALHPSMPLRPGWMSLKIDLPDGGKVTLGTELSLMPGTLSAGVHEGRLLIHVLDTGAGAADAVRVDEARLAHILEQQGRRE